MTIAIEGDGSRGLKGNLTILNKEGMQCLKDFIENNEEGFTV